MNIERLGAYLPIDRRHALATGRPLPDRAQGAVLMADIAGFTPSIPGAVDSASHVSAPRCHTRVGVLTSTSRNPKRE